jgi:hypothetical protein
MKKSSPFMINRLACHVKGQGRPAQENYCRELSPKALFFNFLLDIACLGGESDRQDF